MFDFFDFYGGLGKKSKFLEMIGEIISSSDAGIGESRIVSKFDVRDGYVLSQINASRTIMLFSAVVLESRVPKYRKTLLLKTIVAPEIAVTLFITAYYIVFSHALVEEFHGLFVCNL